MKLYASRSYTLPEKVHFDPSNREHLLDYAEFLKYDNWRRGCPFLLEEPYQDIPMMLRRKTIDFFMRPYLEQV